MAGMFDDLMAQAGAPQPATVPQQPAPRGGLFDDLLASAQPPAAVPHGGINAALPDGLRQFADRLDDYGTSLSKGMVGAAEGVVGLADILSGGGAGNALQEHLGWNPEQRRRELEAEATPEYQASQQAVRGAQGFGDTLQQIMANPSTIPHAVVESLPSMLLGGAVGRGVGAGAQLLGRAAPVLGAAVGEGAVAAGQQAEQTRQATGDLTAGQTAMAVGSGALTGLLGAAGARVGRAFGIADIDAQLAGQQGVDVAKGLVNRVLAGSGIESLEELSQSAQEQVLGNIAAGRDPMSGVGNAAALGAVTGGLMGGAASIKRPVAPGAANAQPVQPADVLAQQAPAAAPASPLTAPQQAPATSAPPAPQQPAAAPPAQPQPVPFAGSQDIAPLLDNLGVQGEQRAQTLGLLAPSEADIEARRRGVVSLDEQRKLASMIGLDGTRAQVFTRKLGEAWNAEQTLAATDLVRSRLAGVLEQQQRIAGGQATDIDRANFVADIDELSRVFGELAGARAEAGRSLAAYRRQVADMRQAQNILEGVGGVQGADNLAQAIGKALQSGGLQNASKLIASRKPGLFDYYYRAALLSGVRTHAVNILSNTATLGNEIVERGIAAGIGAAKRAAGANGQTVFAEPLDLLIGMAKGTGKAAAAAANAVRTGESPLIGAAAKQDASPGIRPKAGALETAFSVPYRLLSGEDAFFATLNYEAELRALARQQALAERQSGALPTGAKLSQRIEQLVAEPTPAMIEQAGEHARTNTFNTKAGAFVQAINAAKTKAPWLNVLAPFVRTPVNIVNYGLKRTPAALAYGDVRADLKAGGAKQERAIARMLWGSTVMVGAGALAQAGYITGGGPEDKKERNALMASGWRPYSIRTGDTFTEYSRLDPFAMWLGLAADLAQGHYQGKEASDVAADLLGSFASNVSSKTWIQGLTDFATFVDDPKRNAGWYVRRMAGTLAQPFTLLSNIAAEGDPYAREPGSILEAIQYRLPGLRETLPQRLDPFGEPMPNRAHPGGALSIAAPLAQSHASDDPVRVESARLGWSPSEPGKSITIKGSRYEFTEEQYRELRELAGQLVHKGAERLMANPLWRNMTDLQRVEALDKLSAKSRAAVRTAFIPYVSTGNRAAIERLRAAINPQEGNSR